MRGFSTGWTGHKKTQMTQSRKGIIRVICVNPWLIYYLRFLRFLLVFLLFVVALRSGWSRDLQERLDARAIRFSDFDKRFIAQILKISFTLFRLPFHQHSFANAIIVKSGCRAGCRALINAQNLITLGGANRFSYTTGLDVLQRSNQVFAQVGQVKLANISFVL